MATRLVASQHYSVPGQRQAACPSERRYCSCRCRTCSVAASRPTPGLRGPPGVPLPSSPAAGALPQGLLLLLAARGPPPGVALGVGLQAGDTALPAQGQQVVLPSVRACTCGVTVHGQQKDVPMVNPRGLAVSWPCHTHTQVAAMRACSHLSPIHIPLAHTVAMPGPTRLNLMHQQPRLVPGVPGRSARRLMAASSASLSASATRSPPSSTLISAPEDLRLRSLSRSSLICSQQQQGWCRWSTRRR